MKFEFDGDKVQGYKFDISFYDNYLFFQKRKDMSIVRTFLSYLLTALGVALGIMSGFMLNPLAISGVLITFTGLVCSILSTKTFLYCTEDLAEYTRQEKLSRRELKSIIKEHELYRGKQFSSQDYNDYTMEQLATVHLHEEKSQYKETAKSNLMDTAKTIEKSFADEDEIENRLN